MDGLLLDTERIVVGCLQDTAEHYGYDDLHATFMDMVGRRMQDSQKVLQAGLAGRMDALEFHNAAAERVRQQLKNSVPVKTTVVELLENLQAANIPCAVASSTRSKDVEHHLRNSGLRDYFTSITGGDQVEHGKPNPEIYLKAAASLQVDAADCVVFEDSEPGTLAGLASGATVVQVPDIRQPSEELKARGHIIATTVLEGALKAGLL